jgi:hypothetical protein
MNKGVIETTSERVLSPRVKEQETVELARKVLATMPPVRDELVNEVRAQIKDGTLDLPGDEIAASLIRHLLDERQNGG